MSDIFLEEGDFEIVLAPGERAHAVLGASGSERWMNCPGSINMSKGMPNRSTIYAMEGTAAHHLGELCLTQDLSADVFEGQFITYTGDLLEDEPDLDGRPTLFFDGRNMDAENPAFEINEGMVKAVNIYLETVDSALEWAREMFKVEPILLIEKSFNLSSVYHDMFGTNDVCIWVPGKCLIVIDYKHGRGKVVKIENNSQLKYYGLGALIELIKSSMDIPQFVETVIVQPRAFHKDGPVRRMSYKTEEITVNFRQELIAAAKRTEDPKAELVKGDWCFFCAGKMKCPVNTGKFSELTKVELYDLTEEELAMPAGLVQKAVNNVIIDPDKIGQLLQLRPVLEAIIKEVHDYALEEVLAGRMHVPGFKPVRKDTKRKIEDETVAADDLISKGHKQEDIFKPAKLKSMTDIKKVKKDPTLLADYMAHVIRPEGAPELAREDDARESLVPKQDADFDLLEEELLALPAPKDAAMDAFDIL